MFRDLGDINSKIIKTVQRIGAEEGVQKVTSKQVAAACGIASYTIFKRFENMQNLLDAAAQDFDRIHMNACIDMLVNNLSIEEVWDKMLDLFMDNPEGALYYMSYISTFGFDPTTANIRAEEFLQIAKVFFHSDRKLTDNQYLILWDYITSMAFYYFEKFTKYLPYTDENKDYVKKIVFLGINNIVN